ncbi:MAG TPA: malonic semialdehyde reductase [Verrucomicrobiae bacterium]|nr:malonic semialdehyde reductase [Verrucomicrobiae bacterium]
MNGIETRPPLAVDARTEALLFSQARTANTFTEEPVSDAQLAAIYDLVKWGPTSANVQPLRILFVRSAAAKARLLPHLWEGNRAKTQAAPVTAVLAADTNFHEWLGLTFPHRPELRDHFEQNPELRADQARFNATLQAGYLLIAVRAAGLAAGPMGGFDRDTLDQDLFPDGRWRSILVVNIGRPGPDAWQDRLPRLSYEEAVRHDLETVAAA